MPKRIKFIPIVLTLAALAAATYLIFPPTKQPKATPPSPEITPPSITPNLTEQKLTDEVEIFRRTLWRHPTSEDIILKAERSHWIDKDSKVQHWRTHLEINPSETLKDHLAKNPFRLNKASPAEISHLNLPLTANTTIQTSPDQTLTLIYNPEQNHLTAIGQGQGFRPPAK